jgi:hypothetical protein
VAVADSASHLVVVAPLAKGTRERARELVADGPPFEPKGTDLSLHRVYLTEREAVFVFESAQPRVVIEQLTGDARMWRAAAAWRDILAARPRLAEQVYDWSRSDGT